MMGHYDECREGYCAKCGQTDDNCKHTKAELPIETKRSKEREIKESESVIKESKCEIKESKCVEAPNLETLKSRPCSLEELQAALVKLIELHNEQGIVMNRAIHKKQDREWRATI